MTTAGSQGSNNKNNDPERVRSGQSTTPPPLKSSTSLRPSTPSSSNSRLATTSRLPLAQSRLSVTSTRSLSPTGRGQDHHTRPSKAPSISSRISSRPGSIRPVITTPAALFNSSEGRAVRRNIYFEVVQSWFRLSTSSRVLLIYYIGATLIEIIATLTVTILERNQAGHCIYLIVFLSLYLVRAIVICCLLLRKFLYVQPDDLPRDLSGACGVHYKTMINWASLVLLLFSVVILTTQSNCVRAAPGLFYLVLVLSLLGYACLAILVFLWLVVMFCLNGLVFLLEIFGVGPTVMQWQGATPEMIDAIPIVKFTNGHRHPSSLDERTTPDEHDNEEQEEIDEKGAGGATAGAAAGAIVATSAFTPAIVVSSLDEGSISGEETGSGGKAEGFVIDIQILESGHNNNDNRTSFEGGSSAANVKTLVTTPNSVESHAFHNIASIATSPFSRTQDEEALALEDLDQEGHQHSSPKQKQQQRRQQQQPQQIENDQTQAGNHNNRISTACPICLCDYEDLEELRHLPCDHFFHKECVDEWLKLKRTCPLCKRDITVNNNIRIKRSWRRRRGNDNRTGSRGSSSQQHH